MNALLTALIVAAVGVPRIALAAQSEPSPAVQITEVRRLLDAGDYDRALTLLDEVVARSERASDDETRTRLIGALELRGRVHFTLGSERPAADDFARLLILSPAHVLPAEVSPRISTFFRQIAATQVGRVTLVPEPRDALLQIDGRGIASSTPISVSTGEHVISATRAGYRAYSAPIVVAGGADSVVEVVLERVSAALRITTTPPGVEVVVNGIASGTTMAMPLDSSESGLPSQLGVSASDIARLVLSDLAPGTYTLQFRRACYVPQSQSVRIDNPRDYRLEPVVLKPAVASLRIESDDPEAVVFIDEQSHGSAPVDVRDLCEGDHIVELRSRGGRYRDRVSASAGAAMKVTGTIKPAFALISVAGVPVGYRGEDLRVEVERVLRNAKSLALITLPTEILKPALAAHDLAADSLSFDATRRPVGGAARITPNARRDVVRGLAQVLDVQGLASITVVDGETSTRRLVVSLFASGASDPDVLTLDLDDTAAIGRALEMLDYAPNVSRPSFGMLGIDVTGVDGVVIARIDSGGPAATAGLKVGERLIQVLDEKTPNESALARVLQQRRAAESLPVIVVGRDNVPRQALVRPVLAPRLLSVFDQTLPFNALAAQWRSRARRPLAGSEAALTRLNLGVAALRIGDFEQAREELSAVQLPTGDGISAGTVQFLLGFAYKGLADLNRAREAWSRASTATGATLSEYGGHVADLAKQELQRLQSPP